MGCCANARFPAILRSDRPEYYLPSLTVNLLIIPPNRILFQSLSVQRVLLVSNDDGGGVDARNSCDNTRAKQDGSSRVACAQKTSASKQSKSRRETSFSRLGCERNEPHRRARMRVHACASTIEHRRSLDSLVSPSITISDRPLSVRHMRGVGYWLALLPMISRLAVL